MWEISFVSNLVSQPVFEKTCANSAMKAGKRDGCSFVFSFFKLEPYQSKMHVVCV